MGRQAALSFFEEIREACLCRIFYKINWSCRLGLFVSAQAIVNHSKWDWPHLVLTAFAIIEGEIRVRRFTIRRMELFVLLGTFHFRKNTLSFDSVFLFMQISFSFQ